MVSVVDRHSTVNILWGCESPAGSGVGKTLRILTRHKVCVFVVAPMSMPPSSVSVVFVMTRIVMMMFLS